MNSRSWDIKDDWYVSNQDLDLCGDLFAHLADIHLADAPFQIVAHK